MGESKRRKEALGEKYGKETGLFPWLPLSKTQADLFMKITTNGTWIAIGLLIAGWVTIRFIGPSFGWWTLQT